MKEYRLPDPNLLRPAGPPAPSENLSRELEAALAGFGTFGGVVEIQRGPAVTLYSIRPVPGTRVSALRRLAPDLARSLGVPSLRVREGLGTLVGIEIPNRERRPVRLSELLGSVSGRLPLLLGRDTTNRPLVADLAKLPHLLIAGATGSGKSVCVNSILTGWLMTMEPKDLRLLLIDPKMVELSVYEGIPHLVSPVITDVAKALSALQWMCFHMDERYRHMKQRGLREWEGCRIVTVVEELADLMMQHPEVESPIVRIAQKGRAAGIHLILATQRPQAKVVTGLIKSNVPGRIAFRTAAMVDSRVILDQNGAEDLLGYGDGLLQTPHSADLLRLQGALVETAEIADVVRFVRSQQGPPTAAPTFAPTPTPVCSDKDLTDIVNWLAAHPDGRGATPRLQDAARLLEKASLAAWAGDLNGIRAASFAALQALACR